MIETRVVDIYNPPRDKDHWVLILRHSNEPELLVSWLSVYVHTQKPVDLGDTVFIDEIGQEVFIARGDHLLYRLDTRCSIPASALQKVHEDIRVVADIYKKGG